MREQLSVLGVGAAVTIVVGLLTGVGWPGYAVGAALAMAPWLMLFFGSLGRPGRTAAQVPLIMYAGASAFAVTLGYLFVRLGDENPVWWAPAFIVAGAVMTGVSFAVADERLSGETSDRG